MNSANQYFEEAKIALSGASRDIDKVIELLDKAIEVDPRASDSRGLKISLLLQKKQTSEARCLINEALAINPLDYAAKGGLVTCLLREGDLKQARRLIYEGLSSDMPDQFKKAFFGLLIDFNTYMTHAKNNSKQY